MKVSKERCWIKEQLHGSSLPVVDDVRRVEARLDPTIEHTSDKVFSWNSTKKGER